MSPRKSRGANETRPLTKSWVTGPAFFAWTQIRATVLEAMIFGALFIFLWWVLDTVLLKRFTMFSEGPHTMAAVLLSGLSIGSSRTFSGNYALSLCHFRVLPLSTRTLAAVLTLLPALSCLCSWVVPVAAYRIMSGHLPWAWALHLELLSILAGLSCVKSSAALSAVGTAARFLSLVLVFMAAGSNTYRYGTLLPPGATGLIGLLGLAGIAAAFVVNARALRRSSSIYKPVLPLSGVSQPRWISE